MIQLIKLWLNAILTNKGWWPEFCPSPQHLLLTSKIMLYIVRNRSNRSRIYNIRYYHLSDYPHLSPCLCCIGFRTLYRHDVECRFSTILSSLHYAYYPQDCVWFCQLLSPMAFARCQGIVRGFTILKQCS